MEDLSAIHSDELRNRMRYLREARRRNDAALKRLHRLARLARQEIEEANVTLAALAAELRRRR